MRRSSDGIVLLAVLMTISVVSLLLALSFHELSFLLKDPALQQKARLERGAARREAARIFADLRATSGSFVQVTPVIVGQSPAVYTRTVFAIFDRSEVLRAQRAVIRGIDLTNPVEFPQFDAQALFRSAGACPAAAVLQLPRRGGVVSSTTCFVSGTLASPMRTLSNIESTGPLQAHADGRNELISAGTIKVESISVVRAAVVMALGDVFLHRIECVSERCDVVVVSLTGGVTIESAQGMLRSRIIGWEAVNVPFEIGASLVPQLPKISRGVLLGIR